MTKELEKILEEQKILARAVKQFTSDSAELLFTGEYKIVAIGPGGDGARGGTSLPNGTNNNTSGTVYGARGGGGGGGGYVYIGTVNVTTPWAILSMVIDEKETKMFGAVNLTLNKDGLSGSNDGGISANVPKPGNSTATSAVYDGSRGGGAGGTRGSRGPSVIDDIPENGGIGDYGNGDNAVLGPSPGGGYRSGGDGAAGGGGNPVNSTPMAGGVGGKGAETNGLVIDDNTMLTITASEVAETINGGSGGNGSAPSSRPAQMGMPGGSGGGGGGSWTDGQNGGITGSPAVGVNAIGGAGGQGGKGSIWLMQFSKEKAR